MGKETTKITKENEGKHKWKHAECDHVEKKKGYLFCLWGFGPVFCTVI
jgi:hypothetical protein